MLLPEDGFKSLLERVKENPRGLSVLISGLWKEMATGTYYSALLFKEIAHFNGGLFENTNALPLSAAQVEMLADAAATDWSGVEPSIFGTLLVRALDPRERHKLGAEFTPRSYVERLIRPTIIGPLREEWDAVRVAAATLHEEADQSEIVAKTQDGTGVLKEAPHSCGAGECEAIERREALSNVHPFAPRQECRGSLPLADLLARESSGSDSSLSASQPFSTSQSLLTRLVALNHERAAEEKRGLIRWLRPDYQAPGATTIQQSEINRSNHRHHGHLGKSRVSIAAGGPAL